MGTEVARSSEGRSLDEPVRLGTNAIEVDRAAAGAALSQRVPVVGDVHTGGIGGDEDSDLRVGEGG